MQYLASETSRACPPLTRIQVWRVTNIVIGLSLAFAAALAGQFYVEFIQPVFPLLWLPILNALIQLMRS